MKIAQISPNIFDVPPKKYGGTERVIHYITEELVRRGQEVTLLATRGSKTNGILYPTADWPVAELKEDRKEIYIIDAMVEFLKVQYNFDLVHVHSEEYGAVFADLIKVPSVFTHHGNFFETSRKIYMKHLDNLSFTALSEAQRNRFPELNFIRTIYHGVDTGVYQFDEIGGGKLYSVSRISPNKGTDLVVQVANKTNNPLVLAGPVRRERRVFFKKEILEKLNSKSRYAGELSSRGNANCMKRSKAFVFPIQWEEPFGLVMTEAMACGTPVVAFARGSVPEVIKDGVTGFIVNSSKQDSRGNWIIKKTGVEGMVEAVKRIYAMPEDEYRRMRQNCRKHVEERFTVEKMVDGYEKVYRKVIEDFKKKKKCSTSSG